MTERLSQELAGLLAEGDGRSDQSESAALLRALLAGDMVEGMGFPRGADTVKVDCSHVAAFLNGNLSSPEWDAMAARLAKDAVARSDVVSAAALLDSIGNQSVKVPVGLAAQAVGLLVGPSSAGPTGPPAITVAGIAGLAWLRRAPTWSGLGIVAAIVMISTAVWLAHDGSAPPPSLDATHTDATNRDGSVESPARDACSDHDAQGKTPPRGPIARAKKNKKPAGGPPDDPCPPVPPDGGNDGRVPSSDQK